MSGPLPGTREVIEIAGVRVPFRWVPPGRFIMGSPEDEAERWGDEGPQHDVTLTRGFWLGETPVTQALYEAVMGTNPSRFRTPNRPVEMVSWEEAKAFCAKVGCRLPTEAEWEYACRAGSTEARYGELDEIAWHVGNSSYLTHPVGEKQPNAWGLYDMLGNVEEWCWDRYGSYAAESQVDPTGPATGECRVLRGGAWIYLPLYCRAAFRDGWESGARYDFVGFRLVRGQALGGGAEEGAREEQREGRPEQAPVQPAAEDADLHAEIKRLKDERFRLGVVWEYTATRLNMLVPDYPPEPEGRSDGTRGDGWSEWATGLVKAALSEKSEEGSDV